jgi:hypothetical protein
MTPTDSIKILIEKSKDYLDTTVELTKLKTIDRSADVLSTVIVVVSMIFLGSLFLLFVSCGLALMLGKMLGAYQYGFFIVGGFYALVLLLIYVQRDKWLKTPITNGLINKMLK